MSQIDVTSMEKAERTQIHQTIKEIFSKIASNTVGEGDKKFIKCFKLNRKSENKKCANCGFFL